jgi:death-on-curing family protein
MSSLNYPDQDDVLMWASLIAKMHVLTEYMPDTTVEWSNKIESCFHTTRLHPDSDNLCASAARVFYKIIQNHYFFDGNKRSAVINTYLFFLLNGYRFNIPADQLYDLSKKVAAEKRDFEKEIKTLSEIFSRHSEQFKEE